MKVLKLFVLFLFFTFGATGQNPFYDIDSLPEIKIYFEEDNWDEILDTYFIAGNQERLMASITIDGTLLDSVGIRYKGFSSASVDRAKNPLNIKLDYIIDSQEYSGISKIKLSNVIQDPSFLREALSYEIARKYMPSAQANFTNVYINDTLWGLYTNVESVNKDFLSNHYSTRDLSFFKGNPDELDLEGENSNLGDSPGENAEDYHEYYQLKSDTGWEDLLDLIELLNTDPDNIEALLNVDRTLWMHAFNYSLINFDSYVGYAQNYYLYQDHNNRFNPILWDMNMSFASFRFTDASEHFDGFNILEAKEMDPLLHYSSVSVIPRPLMRELFNNNRFRKMYIAHLRTIMEENFVNQDYFVRAQEIQDHIAVSVELDTNKFYSNEDFYENLYNTVSDLIDYPGLTDLMDARAIYLQDYNGYEGAPGYISIDSDIELIAGESFGITAEISDGENVFLKYRFDSFDIFSTLEMLDDGLNNDGSPGDGIYGISIENAGNYLDYYIYAENSIAGRFAPERAAYAYFSISGNEAQPGSIVINEIQAANQSTVVDEQGVHEDWVEFYNKSTVPMSLNGLYLSDDINDLMKWSCPNVVVQPDDYAVLWVDDDEQDGFNHVNFDLDATGESLYLSNSTEIVDSVQFDIQTPDLSFARLPNGTGDFQEIAPTYNAENGVISVEEYSKALTISVYPNPSTDYIFIETYNNLNKEIFVFNLNGKLLKSLTTTKNINKIKTADLPIGTYLIQVVSDQQISNSKFIKIK